VFGGGTMGGWGGERGSGKAEERGGWDEVEGRAYENGVIREIVPFRHVGILIIQ
jgi:hypothetical protein